MSRKASKSQRPPPGVHRETRGRRNPVAHTHVSVQDSKSTTTTVPQVSLPSPPKNNTKHPPPKKGVPEVVLPDEDDSDKEDEVHMSRSNALLMSFLEQKGLYLKELLVLEGAEGVATSCRCGSEELALLRCFECHPTDVFCKPCALRRHCHHPFHRVQMWDTSAGYFAPVNLVELGFVYQLMHPDSPCVDTPLGRQPSPPKLQNKHGGDVVLVAHTNGFHRISFSYCRCPGCPSQDP
ncbi:hypothetical protein BOTBODRAFT_174065 [Botryobasidium botryosum FD-172 SS1]|uniref:CxC2-like cysteine cluster KDZ transposase-associated domain-containing protein n=1 Tax=Botryobasidium botryosum (strain FD-172 SS1) TaxID=930990 RepID=A0A067MTM9_BOTB1|nr:hypothetical protein BOTBODRAFT_174065 [Botryobasidium botryosum FD-172 SS1]